jgi:hypothetical protein
MNHLATALLVDNYAKNFNHLSEAVCRTALDFILNECLTVLVSLKSLLSVILAMNLQSQKGNHVDCAAEKASDCQQKTPTTCDDIQIYGKVTFNHDIHPQEPKPTSTGRVTVTGRLDYGIGHVIDANSAKTQQQHCFQSFLVIVEAKVQFSIGQALSQLLILHAFISLDSNATELMCLFMVSLQMDTNSSSWLSHITELSRLAECWMCFKGTWQRC